MAFAPTHRAPDGGLDAYAAPDPTPGATTQIAAGLEVEVVERRADWAQVRTGNGWEGWVDGRRLDEISVVAPPVATPPSGDPTPTAAWGAPPGAPVAAGWAAAPSATAPRSGVRAGTIVALIGGVAFLLFSFLDWRDVGLGGSAWNVPVKTLWKGEIPDFIQDSGLPLGVPILIISAVIIVGALVRPLKILALVGGILALGMTIVFLFQANQIADDARLFGQDFGVADVAGFGAFMALTAGICATVGGVLLLTQDR